MLCFTSFHQAQGLDSQDVTIGIEQDNPYTNKILVYDALGNMVDTLLLIDGEVEILTYVTSGVDSITLVYSHTYQTSFLHKSVYYLSCTLDPETSFYSGRYVSIFEYKSSSIRDESIGDANFCKNFKLLDHNILTFDKQIDIDSNMYISNNVNLLFDVKLVRKLSIDTPHEQIIFPK